jgi:hypothetical protein
MIIDVAWSGGLVLGITHTDEAVIETDDDKFEFCSAVIIHLGFFSVALLFV